MGIGSADMQQNNKQLDGLRGVAILWVIAYHLLACAGMHPSLERLPLIAGLLQTGWIGVMIFFALSGYLITSNRVDVKGEPRYFVAFFCKRAARIIRVYLLLLSTFPIASVFWRPEHAGAVFNVDIPFWSHVIFIQNIYMALSGYMGSGWLRVTWSLAVEVQYYCLIVVVVWLVPKRRLSLVLILTVVISMITRYWVYSAGLTHAAFVTLTPCRIESFAFGGLVASYRRHAQSELYLGYTAGIGIVGALLFLAFANGWFGAYTQAVVPFYYTFLAVACASSVAIGVSHRKIFRFLEVPGLVNIGCTSYFLYLFHMPATLICYSILLKSQPDGSTLGGVVLALLSFLLCWLFANVSY